MEHNIFRYESMPLEEQNTEKKQNIYHRIYQLLFDDLCDICLEPIKIFEKQNKNTCCSIL